MYICIYYYYDYEGSWETVTPSVIVSVVIGAVGLIANGFVLVVLLGFARLKYRPSVLLILHQTVTDAICSAMTLLTQGIYMTLDGKLEGTLGAFLCQVVLNDEWYGWYECYGWNEWYGWYEWYEWYGWYEWHGWYEWYGWYVWHGWNVWQ